ncbi:MAG TPA: carboxypeptidase regulatory-like domain-containing protein [Candidatus Acidoferrales bacterium]|nr:carboxypeptidase regulatory-like domain-containing protein [Candidatus Acidoferrales bacterium]
MKNRKLTRILGSLAVAAAAIALCATTPLNATAQRNDGLLAGSIRSDAGVELDGVTVSARAAGQTITTSVFTDEDGNYYFPRMGAGSYRIWAQAEGFDAGKAEINLSSAAARHDFTLNTIKDTLEIVKQMTGQEYVTALPEVTPEQRKMKDVFYNTCTGCHEPSYILQNRFDEKGWEAILNLMSRVYNGGGEYAGPDMAPFPVMAYYKKQLATYLSEARGPGPSTMQIKLRPRPRGEAARAIVTEYSLPIADPDANPSDDGFPTNDGTFWSEGTPSALNGSRGLHDSQTDKSGNIWFTTSEPSYTRTISMLDAKTGKVTDIKVPGMNGMAAPTHGLAMDPNGVMWATMIGDPRGGGGNLLRVDPATMKYEVIAPPKSVSGTTTSIDVDAKGKVWATTAVGAFRYDPVTREFREFKSPTPIENGPGGSYGIAADRMGNGWWTQINLDRVNRADIESGKTQEFHEAPHAARADGALTADDKKLYELAGVELTDFGSWWSEGPRRLGADRNGDVVWVCDYWGGNLEKYDTRTLKSKTYKYPTPESAPYDASIDREHNVWVNLTNGDSVARFNPATEQWTEFPLPGRGINLRHISLDERDGVTRIVVGYTRNSKIARMQIRSKEELQALKAQVQTLSAKKSVQ